jgi:hypothetical protein
VVRPRSIARKAGLVDRIVLDSLRGQSRRQREVDLRSNGDVEVVGEDIQHHICDDLGDISVGKAMLPQSGNIGIGDLTTLP